MNTLKITSATIISLFLLSCTPRIAQVDVEKFSLADSTRFVCMDLSVELPSGNDRISRFIRDDILAKTYGQLNTIFYESEAGELPSHVSTDDVRSFFDSTFTMADSLSRADYDERAAYFLADTLMSEEDKASIGDYWGGWQISVNVNRYSETENYVVFSSSNYVFLGGAHGGVTGAGYLTYDKASGKLFTSFLENDAARNIQPLIRRGLCSYFSEGGESVVSDSELDECLFSYEGIIPLPAYAPYPTADGLAFEYQQYEIACYAAGMPSFTIPYSDIRPYMTDKAVLLLGL